MLSHLPLGFFLQRLITNTKMKLIITPADDNITELLKIMHGSCCTPANVFLLLSNTATMVYKHYQIKIVLVQQNIALSRKPLVMIYVLNVILYILMSSGWHSEESQNKQKKSYCNEK